MPRKRSTNGNGGAAASKTESIYTLDQQRQINQALALTVGDLREIADARLSIKERLDVLKDQGVSAEDLQTNIDTYTFFA